MTTKHQHSFSTYLSFNRRKFIYGMLATGAVGLTSCTDPQPVQVTVSSTPSPTPSAAPTAAMPVLPPLAPKQYTATFQNGLLAGEELVDHYAKVLDSPSALIHAVRGFGRNFKRADGSNAVEYLCSRFAEEKAANGKNFIHFIRRDVEVHENSFLKTFLEAGVSLEQPVIVKGKKYTLQNLADDAKSLFRIDPNNLGKYESNYTHEHLPWGLIAFANMMPGGKGEWVNAFGEKIDFMSVIDKSLAEFETVCTALKAPSEKDEAVPESFRGAIKLYSCYGGHSIYSYVSCLRHGYTGANLAARVNELMDGTIYRLAKESENIEKEHRAFLNMPISPNPQEDKAILAQLEKAGMTKADLIEILVLKGVIKLTGHLFEAINYAKLHNLFKPTPAQATRIKAGETKLVDALVKLRAFNLEAYKSFNAGQLNELVIALGHAIRAMKIPGAANPDTNPKSI